MHPCPLLFFFFITLVASQSSSPSMAFPGDITSQDDIDNLVRLESERLTQELQNHSRRRTVELIQTLNHQASNLLNQKDVEILRANHRTMDLQRHINHSMSEVDAWKKRADEGKAIAKNLLRAVNHAKQQARANNNKNATGGGVESVGSNDDRLLQQALSGPRFACKVCGGGSSCMVLLPCRHLCCCKVCIASVNHCPVCGLMKKSAVEASM